MRIDTESNEMHWILIKFLKDSLEFLSDQSALGGQRKAWVKTWMGMNLQDQQIVHWMPDDRLPED